MKLSSLIFPEEHHPAQELSQGETHDPCQASAWSLWRLRDHLWSLPGYNPRPFWRSQEDFRDSLTETSLEALSEWIIRYRILSRQAFCGHGWFYRSIENLHSRKEVLGADPSFLEGSFRSEDNVSSQGILGSWLVPTIDLLSLCCRWNFLVEILSVIKGLSMNDSVGLIIQCQNDKRNT